jgi:hypothetical protein
LLRIPSKSTVETYSITDSVPYHHCRNSEGDLSFEKTLVAVIAGDDWELVLINGPLIIPGGDESNHNVCKDELNC